VPYVAFTEPSQLPDDDGALDDRSSSFHRMNDRSRGKTIAVIADVTRRSIAIGTVPRSACDVVRFAPTRHTRRMLHRISLLDILTRPSSEHKLLGRSFIEPPSAAPVQHTR
jgi:hypothetical protein